MRALVIASFMMLGSVNAAAGQFTLQDDISLNKYLYFNRDLEFVLVRMSTYPYQGREVRYDDRRLVADLRRMGLRALRPDQDPQSIDHANISYVIARCSKAEILPPNPGTTVSIATSVHIEIWDHIRSTTNSVYRLLTVSTVGRSAYRSGDEVEHCGDLLSDPLIRMGFER